MVVAEAGKRVLIISPVRNEAEFFERTLASVCSQQLLPVCWVIVDDGSTDATATLARDYAARYPFIQLLHLDQHQVRELGPRVVQNFNVGLEFAREQGVEFDFVCKLDGDLEFGPEAFATIVDMFTEDSSLGMAGPSVFLRLDSGREIFERYARYHVPGQFKVYRRECFESMGGLFQVYGWDIADETEARRRGWETRHTDAVRVIHLRLQGSAFGIIKGRRIWGWGAYATWSYPPFAILRGVFRLVEPPYIIGGIAFIWGFIEAHWKGIKRVPEPAFGPYIRAEHKRRLLSFNRKTR